ncbi:uncharacterized protein LOC124632594 [Helicoverpa zea]|uniref:uncharacterized protein LOC124632594 n=1 Tax=Helicoverpa zea TaxID=7113 RepID=UPI001F56CE05|nr:uncharacterized protein LOC124632594 [Helicoverpa zea]
MSDFSDDDDIYLTPTELIETVNNVQMTFLPQQSREKYLKQYEMFNTWRIAKGAKTFSENVLLAYFVELYKTRKSSTLWSTYSMLKATIKMKKDINIETYTKLLAFLKRASSGHQPKKSKVFTASEIEKFVNNAPDSMYLAAKVVLIIGINGACRTNELTLLNVTNIEKHSDELLLIHLTNTKTKRDRNFVIRKECAAIVEKYKALRPLNTPTNRFFLQYRNGKCVRQPMGSNKIGSIPREIATFLELPEPQLYTGHCFRRTSATLLADSGADLLSLKRHGGWKSNAVVEGYIEDSIENKSKICKGIVGAITLNKPLSDPWTGPSTSTMSQWLWAPALLAVLGAAIILVILTVERYEETPIYMVQHEQVFMKRLFPAVTLCPEVRFVEEKIDAFLDEM